MTRSLKAAATGIAGFAAAALFSVLVTVTATSEVLSRISRHISLSRFASALGTAVSVKSFARQLAAISSGTATEIKSVGLLLLATARTRTHRHIVGLVQFIRKIPGRIWAIRSEPVVFAAGSENRIFRVAAEQRIFVVLREVRVFDSRIIPLIRRIPGRIWAICPEPVIFAVGAENRIFRVAAEEQRIFAVPMEVRIFEVPRDNRIVTA